MPPNPRVDREPQAAAKRIQSASFSPRSQVCRNPALKESPAPVASTTLTGKAPHGPIHRPLCDATLRAELAHHQSVAVVQLATACFNLLATCDALDLHLVRQVNIHLGQGIEQFRGPLFGKVVAGIERRGQASAAGGREAVLQAGPQPILQEPGDRARVGNQGRSCAEVETVIPVLRSARRGASDTSTPVRRNAPVQKSPYASAPTVAAKVTESPRRANPAAQIAEDLPRVAPDPRPGLPSRSPERSGNCAKSGPD